MSSITALALRALQEDEDREARGEPTETPVINAAPGTGFGAFSLAAIRAENAREACGEKELSPWGIYVRKRSLIKAMRRRDSGGPPLPRDARIFEEVEMTPTFYGLDVVPRPDMTGQQLSEFIGGQDAFYTTAPLALSNWQPKSE